MLAYAFSLNDYSDGDVSKKYFLFPLITTFILLPFYNFVRIFYSMIFILLVTTYSVTQIRLKSIPIISLTINGIGFTFIALFGYGSLTFNLPVLLFFVILTSLNLVSQLIHEIVDIKDDIKNKIKSTASVIGYRKSLGLAKCLMLISLIGSVFLSVYMSRFFIFFLSIAVFSAYFISFGLKAVNKKTRIRYKNLGLVVGFIYLLSLIYT